MRFSDEEREAIMENLPTRLAELAPESTKTLEAVG
ncbi:putative Fe-S protein YdhL (DUF1289 family) [Rhizobium viscosum]|uniref:Fe-S protein YdhL (DUF1289 family) n=2 Tax=Rhizobium viscosum TaxID=1673 RepID=A0ABR9J227_RHIVS|nr:putative Fe-S protein YdhL (DUF1289 family) [Rhizobium viscosum]